MKTMKDLVNEMIRDGFQEIPDDGLTGREYDEWKINRFNSMYDYYKGETNMDKVYFAKIKKGAKIPSKDLEDGCYDVYACFDEDYIVIKPHSIELIPTGIASAFSDKYRFGVRERGSTGTKGMAIRAGQIDSGYRGEWFIPINNTTDKVIVITKDIEGLSFIGDCFKIYPYDKAICQVALEEVPVVEIVEVSYSYLQEFKSKRGTGCLGDSGK